MVGMAEGLAVAESFHKVLQNILSPYFRHDDVLLRALMRDAAFGVFPCPGCLGPSPCLGESR